MRKINITEFDASKYLTDEKVIAEYLSISLEEGDVDLFIHALANVAKARGIAQIAKDAGISRESLYKSLSDGAKPRFETILKLANAAGFNISFSPANKPAHASR